jgi:hypothetical protein
VNLRAHTEQHAHTRRQSTRSAVVHTSLLTASAQPGPHRARRTLVVNERNLSSVPLVISLASLSALQGRATRIRSTQHVCANTLERHVHLPSMQFKLRARAGHCEVPACAPVLRHIQVLVGVRQQLKRACSTNKGWQRERVLRRRGRGRPHIIHGPKRSMAQGGCWRWQHHTCTCTRTPAGSCVHSQCVSSRGRMLTADVIWRITAPISFCIVSCSLVDGCLQAGRGRRAHAMVLRGQQAPRHAAGTAACANETHTMAMGGRMC